jgi:uncharacterized 2Fe-2S/4Fe-4S cluster protein (DUF4445 family)
MNTDSVRIRLEPLSVEFEVKRGARLLPSLAERGIEFPCGGKGSCGSCGIRLLSGTLPVSNIDSEFFPPEKLEAGWRLGCHAIAEMSLVVECGQWHMDVLTDTSKVTGAGKPGLGIAIDLGTTTIAGQVVDMAAGNVLGVETMLNPQAAFGSDVMSRIHAALEGADLTSVVRTALRELVARLAVGREHCVKEVILVGNTVMHHLFSGFDMEPLSHVPFASPHLEEQLFTPRQLCWPLPEDCVIRFARCIGGFVGADILAGIIATGMNQSDELSALVDLGTNGEIAIGNRDGIICASAAAGPAFEAGGIRMGMRAATGAIAHVTACGDQMEATVIGDRAPRGICGSGLVDAVAAGLRSGAIASSGRISNGRKMLPIAGPVVLYQSDVRELQLAKGAIAAGFKLLLKQIGAGVPDLTKIHLAGAFGNCILIDSAMAIGLLNTPKEVIHAAGNTALRGAKMMLLAVHAPILPPLRHVSLAAEPGFQDEFASCMAFPGSCTRIVGI